MAAGSRPLVANLCGDARIAEHFTALAEVAAITTFERELAGVQAALGLVPLDAARAIEDAGMRLPPDMDEIGRGMAKDGVPVPALVREMKRAVGEPHSTHVHLGATSQDAVDTGLMLRLKAVCRVLDERLKKLLDDLARLARQQGATRLMAQTRMQAALPFTAADKLATWTRPLQGHRARLAGLSRNLPIQLGGPVGNGDGFGPAYPALRRALAERLGLADAAPWHSDRTVILDVAQNFALLTGTLAKVGQDLALMAQNGVGSVKLSGAGGSSAMAHKQNPVRAEALVALGRFNAGLLGTLSQSMIHENERSGAAWTLEWLVLPPMAEATGAATNLAESLLGGLRFRELD